MEKRGSCGEATQGGKSIRKRMRKKRGKKRMKKKEVLRDFFSLVQRSHKIHIYFLKAAHFGLLNEIDTVLGPF